MQPDTGRRGRDEPVNPEELYNEFVREKYSDLPPGWVRVKRAGDGVELFVDHTSREAWTETPMEAMKKKGVI